MTRRRKQKTLVTTRERLAIVEEAIRLIRKPGTWIQKKWQCEITKPGARKPAYAYCLDGAIGQAAINILGEERALRDLKITATDVGDGPIVDDGGISGEILSIRKLAFDALTERGHFQFESFSDEWMEDDDSWHVVFNDNTKTTHKDVLALLRKKARQLRAKIKALDARAAKRKVR